MAANVTLNGVVYAIPAEGDSGWGTVLQNYFIALSTSTFQKSGGNFSLTAETNFGANFGLKSYYYKSQATNSSASGVLRLGNSEAIGWRNAANNGDLTLAVDGLDNLNFNGSSLSIGGTPVQSQLSVTDSSTINLHLSSNDIIANIIASSIDNSHISDSAAIDYTKLALSGALVDSDIGAAAAISYSKLALANSIVNADISSSAAIAFSKMAPLTASRALATSVSGVIEAATTTFAELNYLSGVTSSVQTQLNTAQTAIAGKEPTVAATTSADYYRGDKTFQPLNKAAVGLANADDTSDASKPISTATQAALDLKQAAATAVTLTGTQSVSNKTLTSTDFDGGTASNTSRITLPKASKTTLDGLARKAGSLVFDTTSNKPYYDDGSALQLVGSGSGGGGTNYLTNGDFESGLTGWANAGISPVGPRPNSTNGTNIALITVSSTATAPLSGGTSGVITKGATNCQGGTVYKNFIIDSKDKGRVLQVSFDYQLVSGTYNVGTATTDSDLIAGILDTTNGTYIELSNFKLNSNSTTIATKFSASFQTASNSVDYVFVFHVATTGTAAWTMKVDNIAVSPSVYVYGSPVTDWQSFTPSGTWTTNATYSGKYRRVGDTAEVSINITTTGAPNAAVLQVNMPPGMAIDTTKILSTNPDLDAKFGFVRVLDAATVAYMGGSVGYSSPTAVYVYISTSGGSWTGANAVSNTLPFTFGAGDGISIIFAVPILGWSSSVQMSDSGGETRLVAASYSTLSSTTITAGTALKYTTVQRDTHTMYTPATGVTLIQSPGQYRISIGGSYSNSAVDLQLFVNGVNKGIFGTISQGRYSSGLEYPLNAGDSVTIVPAGSVTAADTTGWFSVSKLSGPSAIASSESVNCAYTGATTSASGTASVIKFATKDRDTHGIYDLTTGLATIPISGTYRLSGQWRINVAGSVASQAVISIYRNGTVIRQSGVTSGNATTMPYYPKIDTEYHFNAGDTVGFYATQSLTSSTAIENSIVTFMSISRIGN